jgi:hypothetical protein
MGRQLAAEADIEPGFATSDFVESPPHPGKMLLCR